MAFLKRLFGFIEPDTTQAKEDNKNISIHEENKIKDVDNKKVRSDDGNGYRAKLLVDSESSSASTVRFIFSESSTTNETNSFFGMFNDTTSDSSEVNGFFGWWYKPNADKNSTDSSDEVMKKNIQPLDSCSDINKTKSSNVDVHIDDSKDNETNRQAKNWTFDSNKVSLKISKTDDTEIEMVLSVRTIACQASQDLTEEDGNKHKKGSKNSEYDKHSSSTKYDPKLKSSDGSKTKVSFKKYTNNIKRDNTESLDSPEISRETYNTNEAIGNNMKSKFKKGTQNYKNKIILHHTASTDSEISHDESTKIINFTTKPQDDSASSIESMEINITRYVTGNNMKTSLKKGTGTKSIPHTASIEREKSVEYSGEMTKATKDQNNTKSLNKNMKKNTNETISAGNQNNVKRELGNIHMPVLDLTESADSKRKEEQSEKFMNSTNKINNIEVMDTRSKLKNNKYCNKKNFLNKTDSSSPDDDYFSLSSESEESRKVLFPTTKAMIARYHCETSNKHVKKNKNHGIIKNVRNLNNTQSFGNRKTVDLKWKESDTTVGTSSRDRPSMELTKINEKAVFDDADDMIINHNKQRRIKDVNAPNSIILDCEKTAEISKVKSKGKSETPNNHTKTNKTSAVTGDEKKTGRKENTENKAKKFLYISELVDKKSSLEESRKRCNSAARVITQDHKSQSSEKPIKISKLFNHSNENVHDPLPNNPKSLLSRVSEIIRNNDCKMRCNVYCESARNAQDISLTSDTEKIIKNDKIGESNTGLQSVIENTADDLEFIKNSPSKHNSMNNHNDKSKVSDHIKSDKSKNNGNNVKSAEEENICNIIVSFRGVFDQNTKQEKTSKDKIDKYTVKDAKHVNGEYSENTVKNKTSPPMNNYIPNSQFYGDRANLENNIEVQTDKNYDENVGTSKMIQDDFLKDGNSDHKHMINSLYYQDNSNLSLSLNKNYPLNNNTVVFDDEKKNDAKNKKPIMIYENVRKQHGLTKHCCQLDYIKSSNRDTYYKETDDKNISIDKKSEGCPDTNIVIREVNSKVKKISNYAKFKSDRSYSTSDQKNEEDVANYLKDTINNVHTNGTDSSRYNCSSKHTEVIKGENEFKTAFKNMGTSTSYDKYTIPMGEELDINDNSFTTADEEITTRYVNLEDSLQSSDENTIKDVDKNVEEDNSGEENNK